MIVAYVAHHGRAARVLAPLVERGELERVETVRVTHGHSYEYEDAGQRLTLGPGERALLVGFSAGCSFVRGALRALPPGLVAGVVLLDGAHAPHWQGVGVPPQVWPLANAARDAAERGTPRVFWTASSIEPGAYMSTRAVLGRVASELGMSAPLGVSTRGGLRFVVTAGDDAGEHVEHAGMLLEGVTWALPRRTSSLGWLLGALGLGWLARRRLAAALGLSLAGCSSGAALEAADRTRSALEAARDLAAVAEPCMVAALERADAACQLEADPPACRARARSALAPAADALDTLRAAWCALAPSSCEVRP